MDRAGRIAALAAIAAFASLAPSAPAQVVYTESYPDNYPPPLPRRQGPQPPPLVLEWVGEVALPGPLRPGSLRVDRGEVVVPTDDGVLRVSTSPGAETVGTGSPAAAAPGPDRFAWVPAGDGKHRCRATPQGGVLVEKRRREGSRWRTAWELDTTSPLACPPIPVGPRLVLPTSEGRVWAARLSNGHRLWATDIGERLSAPPVLWTPESAAEETASKGREPPYRLLLLVPDSGAALLALDVYDGRVLARGTVPEGLGRLVSPPLLLEDGRIAVSRQGYALEDAGLGFFRVREESPTARGDAPATVPYNAADSPSNPPTRR